MNFANFNRELKAVLLESVGYGLPLWPSNDQSLHYDVSSCDKLARDGLRLNLYRMIVLLTFKCLHGLAPKYLADLISVHSAPRYNLRSTGTISLTPASAKCFITLGDRAFQQAAAKLWNNLPTFIRNLKSLNSFKAAIKTHYFKLAFN